MSKYKVNSQEQLINNQMGYINGPRLLDKVTHIILNKRRIIYKHLWIFIQRHVQVRNFCFYHLPTYYTRLRYFNVFGRPLNLKYPDTLEAKLFWLSVCYRHPLIMKCADKFHVRKYVEACACGDILNTLYGVYDSAYDIPFATLPNMFVIKSNRGSGDNFFCLDKSSLHTNGAIELLESWRQHTYGIENAEYQYAKMPFKLIVERYLKDSNATNWTEYQFFCFNDKPVSILVRNDLETQGEKPFAESYSLLWEREYLRKDEEQYQIEVPRPATFNKMVEYACRLSKPFPHVRVDFYEVGGKLIFGELTFSTHGNVLENYKESVLAEWNKLLILPKEYKGKDRY